MRPISSLLVAAPLLAVPLLAVPSGGAAAHAWPTGTTPPAGSTVVQPPAEVTIAFSEAIEPAFSSIAVTGPDSHRVDDGNSHPTGADGKHLAVSLSKLAPGVYTVAWHATAVDTHKTDGAYRFTVAATDATGITLEHVWARPTAGMATSGAVWFTITDHGQPDHLVDVSTPVAAKAEVHETIDDNGVMKMRPVPSIALDPGKPVAFKPGGYHVMLTGLKGPLKAGDSFPITLKFEHAAPITVTAKVEAGAPMDHSQMDHGQMGGMGAMPGMK